MVPSLASSVPVPKPSAAHAAPLAMGTGGFPLRYDSRRKALSTEPEAEAEAESPCWRKQPAPCEARRDFSPCPVPPSPGGCWGQQSHQHPREDVPCLSQIHPQSSSIPPRYIPVACAMPTAQLQLGGKRGAPG